MLHYHYLVGIDLLTPLSSSLFSTIHYLYKINPIFRLLRTYRAAQKTRAFLEDQSVNPKNVEDDALVGHEFEAKLKEGETVILTKYTAICTSFYYEENDLEKRAAKTLESAVQTGYEKSKKAHSAAWNAKWQDMDVAIEGDVAAQQGIRYTIFQLHQTYTGEDPRLNIGPKGFTGEKYGGCTYWDTEAYCLPFYLSTAKETVGKNLLKYRFDHLPKAIENAKKLGFGDGAALFPMVTMTGEECHNEWEITFEEIHRNGVMAYAIFDYVRYTGNKSYIPEYGLEVLVAITLQTVPPISLHTVPVISLQTVPLSIMNNIVLALLKKQYQHGRKQKKHYGYQTSITTQTKRI